MDSNLEGLKGAIRAADLPGSRIDVIARAKAAGHEDLIPDNWTADGALTRSRTLEKRDTASDVFAALEGAVSDAVGDEYYGCWVQDWYGAGDDGDPYMVVYYSRGDLWAAPFSFDAENKVAIGDAVKVRPVTSYVERSADSAFEARCRRAEMLDGIREVRRFHADSFEMRETTDGQMRFSGYASATERAYEVGGFEETIARGAFKRTLSESPDVVFLVNHGEGGQLPLARTKSGTMTLSEDARGLRVDADLNPNDPDVRALIPKLERGDVDEMSFAFRVTDQSWSEDRTKRTIRGVTIHKGDVSIVTYGANDASTGGLVAARSADGLLEVRAGKAISAENAAKLQTVLDRIARADVELDAAQPEIADMLGVENPDADDRADGKPAEMVVPVANHTARARQELDLLRVRGAR